VRINYFSDIHLEFGELGNPDNDADLIIAAGDIGVYLQGVEWLKSLEKKVIYVAGNHEFYSREYFHTIKAIRENCKNSQVTFLENEEFIYQGVRFLGCTLWADLFVEGDDKAAALGQTLNDFRRIEFNDNTFDQVAFSSLYKKSRNWLESKLAEPFDGETVVITHHAPTEWSWYKSPQALKKLAYCNDLKALFHEYEIAIWFHGHVHNTGNYRIAGTQILSNPRGYHGRRLVEGFNVDQCVDI
jgi:predicted phosphodiesterase